MPIQEYICTFDTKYKKIEKKGVIYPSEILAFQLVKKANITRKEKALVFAGVNFKNRTTIYEDVRRLLNIVKGDSVLSSDLSLKQEIAFIEVNKENFNAKYIKSRKNGHKNGWSKTGHKEAGENQRTESGINQTGIKKKISPTGRDGQIFTCKSCGLFRHLLDACPDSWENMAKNNTEVKPLNQDGAEKTLRAKTQLKLGELTAELNCIKKETTTLKEDVKSLKADKDNDEQRNNGEIQSLELKLEQEKLTRIRLESTITALQQKILKLDAEREKVSDKIGSAAFQAKMIVTKVEKDMLLLKAQNESLSEKHKNHILSAKLHQLTRIEQEILEIANVVKQQLQADEEELKNKIWREQAISLRQKYKYFKQRENLGKLMT